MTTNHTVPYGTELVSRRDQALRTWLPSFSPFLLRRPELRRTSRGKHTQYLSTFSKPSLRVAGFEDENEAPHEVTDEFSSSTSRILLARAIACSTVGPYRSLKAISYVTGCPNEVCRL